MYHRLQGIQKTLLCKVIQKIEKKFKNSCLYENIKLNLAPPIKYLMQMQIELIKFHNIKQDKGGDQCERPLAKSAKEFPPMNEKTYNFPYGFEITF